MIEDHTINKAANIHTIYPCYNNGFNAGDYRPISLVFAKLVAKILANRLAPHFNSLISSNQNAFIHGRCISVFMMVQQTIKLLHRRKVTSLFLKLNISKAFDSFSWSFLLELLHYLGFGWLWCNLISNLLTTSSARIILNGEPGESINHQEGLRQGDPLSPMLFILAMDVHNGLFVKVGEEGFLQPLSNHSAGVLENGSLYMQMVLPYSYSQ